MLINFRNFYLKLSLLLKTNYNQFTNEINNIKSLNL